MSSPDSSDNESFEFNYLKLRKQVGIDDPQEKVGLEKLKAKIKENPFVPIGTLLTCSCLLIGLQSMYRGDSARSQFAMRGRIIAQGFTIAALLIGIFAKGPEL